MYCDFDCVWKRSRCWKIAVYLNQDNRDFIEHYFNTINRVIAFIYYSFHNNLNWWNIFVKHINIFLNYYRWYDKFFVVFPKFFILYYCFLILSFLGKSICYGSTKAQTSYHYHTKTLQSTFEQRPHRTDVPTEDWGSLHGQVEIQ